MIIENTGLYALYFESVIFAHLLRGCLLLTMLAEREFTVYLSKEKENLWRDFDRELYDGLQKLMHPNIRKVSLIEQTNFLPGARYFSRIEEVGGGSQVDLLFLY